MTASAIARICRGFVPEQITKKSVKPAAFRRSSTTRSRRLLVFGGARSLARSVRQEDRGAFRRFSVLAMQPACRDAARASPAPSSRCVAGVKSVLLNVLLHARRDESGDRLAVAPRRCRMAVDDTSAVAASIRNIDGSSECRRVDRRATMREASVRQPCRQLARPECPGRETTAKCAASRIVGIVSSTIRSPQNASAPITKNSSVGRYPRSWKRASVREVIRRARRSAARDRTPAIRRGRHGERDHREAMKAPRLTGCGRCGGMFDGINEQLGQVRARWTRRRPGPGARSESGSKVPPRIPIASASACTRRHAARRRRAPARAAATSLRAAPARRRRWRRRSGRTAGRAPTRAARAPSATAPRLVVERVDLVRGDDLRLGRRASAGTARAPCEPCRDRRPDRGRSRRDTSTRWTSTLVRSRCRRN